MNTERVTPRDRATILAALELWQSELERFGDGVTDGNEHFTEHDPLSLQEVGQLRQRLLTGQLAVS